MHTEKEYYGKAYSILRFIRYIVLVLLALLIVVGMTVYKDEITVDNFRYLMKYIDIEPPIVSDAGNTIKYSASSSSSYSFVSDKLIVSGNESVSSYDISGIRLFTESLGYQDPVCLQSGKYLLIYDMDGYELSVFNSFSKITEKQLENPIEGCYLEPDGSFAVITKKKTFSGGVQFYNSKFKKTYSVMMRSDEVTDICSDSGENLLCCVTTGVLSGDFHTKLLLFEMGGNGTENEGEAKYTAELFGEMPLCVFCHDKKFYLITDKGMHIYDGSAKEKGYYGFELGTLGSVYRFDGNIVLLIKSSFAGTDTVMKILDYDGNELYSGPSETEIVDVSEKDGAIYLLKSTSLETVRQNADESFYSDSVMQTDGEYKKVFGISDTKVLLCSEKGAGTFDVLPEENENNDTEKK